MWQKVIERFEERAPGAVMAHLAIDQALPASWIDEVFEANRGRQYSRNLLFSSVVEHGAREVVQRFSKRVSTKSTHHSAQ